MLQKIFVLHLLNLIGSSGLEGSEIAGQKVSIVDFGTGHLYLGEDH